MQRVKTGDCVTVDYEGSLEDGKVFETTADAGSLEFVVGSNAVLPPFEKTIIGMAAGETRSIEVPPEQAYGPRREELVQDFDRTAFGEGIDPKPGMILGMAIEREGQDEKVPGLVTEVDGSRITIDFNHPLAGKVLVFKITLRKIGEHAVGNGCQPADDSCSSSGCSSCN